ncbi:glycosyltransferase family A protein [Sanguibacter sp. 4.1]|uniref:Glycosyltransferase family A protein n=1 Tax=Sanguibacter biliveldensis TaxID=3030830 RepID=A0AAF0Z6A4_9MICO|nr:glycosyltransferase family A protein [Sanguibacter sp. 4.1]WPF83475.1 glycosyltransferase family A protein [Sanguibacter sp. 4.1]
MSTPEHDRESHHGGAHLDRATPLRPEGQVGDDRRRDAAGPSVGVVVTAFDQGRQVCEAVDSILAQTHAVSEVVVVDDGSTDPESVAALDDLGAQTHSSPTVRVLRQANSGVSAARNAGIAALSTEVVAVLDGDDLWEPTFVASTLAALVQDHDVVAASSWLSMFGVAAGGVEPAGGSVEAFLPRNAAPASLLIRHEDWQQAGGYDETMTQGFEDWDFYLRLLRRPGTRVEVVREPLLRYRTHPASANVRSMEARVARYAQVLSNHRDTFAAHLEAALLGLEATSTARLAAWEDLVVADPSVEVGPVTFGDGGMASAVRIATARARTTS